MARAIPLLFHVIALSSQLFAFGWMFSLGILNWRVLSIMFTLWTGIAEVAYFFLAFTEDIYRTSLHYKTIHFGFFICFLMSLATAIIFWAIYLTDPELIVPKQFYYPTGLNHLQHTVPAILMFIEIFFRDQEYLLQDFWRTKFSLIFAVPTLYLGFIGYLRYSQGTWPYPFMQSWLITELVLFYFFAMILAIALHSLAHFLIKTLSPKKKVKQI